MSKTYKDMPAKIRYPEVFLPNEVRYNVIEYEAEGVNWYTKKPYAYRSKRWLDKPGWKPKKRRNVDVEWHWMSTPGWWVSMFMTRPQRHAGKMWERKVLKANIEDVDLLDTPNVSRKPHIYYY